MTAGSFRAGGLFIFVKEMINIAIKLATSITYTADGSQTNFSIPFDYLRPSFVHVAVNDAEVSEGFTVSNRGIMFDTAPAKDALVKIYRKTPTSRLVSWADASILKAIDMTIAEVQQLHILEEASDWSKTNSIVLDEEGNTWQGRNCRMSNIADPTEAQDVVTKHYLDNEEGSFTATMNALKTKTEEAASTAETNAKQARFNAEKANSAAVSAERDAATALKSANNAKTSETNVNASKEAAQSAATAASNFASAARNSAGEAKTYKDNAKTYMDNAELYMNNAKNYSENVNVFVPSVSSAGVLSWTNKAGLPNPASVNIKGAKGDKGDTGAQGIQGVKGDKGDTGEQGLQGIAGTAATIRIGSVYTGEPGTNASVTNSGTSTNAILNFTIPRGNPGSGGGTSIDVDAELSDSSLNPVQNKVIYNALKVKMNTADVLSGFALLGGATNIRWREGTQFIGSINASNYSGTARAATHDGDGNVITSTYAKKTDISGVVKSVNGTAPDESGNVTITATGGVSTSSENTWTAVQEFYNTKTFRAYHTGYFVEGTSDTPVTDTMWYTTNGDFTLNLSNFAMLLGTYESIVFSAYFTADTDHALTISGAGTMTYIGSASDIAISGSGTLLTVWMIKNPNGVVSIVQAHKLGSGEVNIKDGNKHWNYDEVNNKTIAFTVPLGIKRIKVFAEVDYAENDPETSNYAVIKNTTSNNKWGEGYSGTDESGVNVDHENIDSIVGVTPNKTYTLHFDCYATSGVTFSWGKAINAMTPTVEDY